MNWTRYEGELSAEPWVHRMRGAWGTNLIFEETLYALKYLGWSRR